MDHDVVEHHGLVWYWDHDGRPCSVQEWGRQFECRWRRETRVGDVLVISAYLGTNDGTPLAPDVAPDSIYGTLVQGKETFSPNREHADGVHDAEVARLQEAQ